MSNIAIPLARAKLLAKLATCKEWLTADQKSPLVSTLPSFELSPASTTITNGGNTKTHAATIQLASQTLARHESRTQRSVTLLAALFMGRECEKRCKVKVSKVHSNICQIANNAPICRSKSNLIAW
ncbi:Uncharacterised protein [Vibrio cholerae]|nr:Uncharacterised protein [Vibrio cholerae]